MKPEAIVDKIVSSYDGVIPKPTGVKPRYFTTQERCSPTEYISVP